MAIDLKSLIETLNPHCKGMLERAAQECMNRTHYQVGVEHLLWVMLENGAGDLPRLLRGAQVDPAEVQRQLGEALSRYPAGNTGGPTFSHLLILLFRHAFHMASHELEMMPVRSGVMLLTLLGRPLRYTAETNRDWLDVLKGVSGGMLRQRFSYLIGDSVEGGQSRALTPGSRRPTAQAVSSDEPHQVLLSRLNDYSASVVKQAVNMAAAEQHRAVYIEHVLGVMLRDGDADLAYILDHFGVSSNRLREEIAQTRAAFGKAKKDEAPEYATALIELLESAWSISSTQLGKAEIRSGALVRAFLKSPGKYAEGDWYTELEFVDLPELEREFYKIVLSSKESRNAGAVASRARAEQAAPITDIHQLPEDSALAKYAMNLTQRARGGEIDPIFGRDREIRQIIDILVRRRKNNPIIVGEAGVGKTALAEGLALRIVSGDVPNVLRGRELFSLDMGLLQAGASVKGEFEARLKKVIDEVKNSQVPIIVFIDEAHTMIGAGGAQGSTDAANLLKPALARGELKTIAATTWSEYKKYFEKDAALSRRFQVVKVDEPSVSSTITMLRGLRTKYEEAHEVILRDDALVAAAELAARYITGRLHPDKGIDLIDTAAARVRVALETEPADLEGLWRQIAALNREKAVLERDAEQTAVDPEERLTELAAEVADLQAQADALEAEWRSEQEAAEVVIEARQTFNRENETLVNARRDLQRARKRNNAEAIAAAEGTIAREKTRVAPYQTALREALAALEEAQGKDALVNVEVTPEVVGRVVSDWTGIPLGKMVRDQATTLLRLEDDLQSRIKGQDHAMTVIAERVRASKAGLGNPSAPMGVFLFVGPSGVGKTETALGVADLLFGGEKFMTTINMSEFQEKHTVSRLIGSPPGYVGYGEGGVLTEAVRQRPYSVVLLDEVEKAHPEVLNLFYQVFDKGMLSDGEGRVIDFKDTIIFLTSNLASDITMEMCQDGKVRPDIDDVSAQIRPVLNKHFKPALLARMSVVPYYPIGRDVMREIVVLKLGKLKRQLAEAHKVTLTISDRVLDLITARCTMAETGARNVDYIINGSLLPRISSEVLTQLADGTLPDTLTIDGQDDEFTFTFSDGPIELAPYEPPTEEADEPEPEPEPEPEAAQAAPAALTDQAPTPALNVNQAPGLPELPAGLSPAERAQELAAQAQAMLAKITGGKPAADEPPADEG